MKKTTDEWHGCYPSNWKGLIVEEAYAHPAKFSNKLIRRIYDHILEEGWVKPGDLIVDCFGGVSLGALDAMRLGLRWRGCELEERFVKWGNENILFWNKKFGSMPKWSGDAVLLQGDSRFLSQVLCGAHTVVTSPPYAETRNAPGGANENDMRRNYHGDGNYQVAVSSPPFSDVLSRDNLSASDRRSLADEKGISNTEHISPIDMEKIGKRNQESYGGMVSSPPYGASINSDNGIDVTKIVGGQGGPNAQDKQTTRYGTQSAQLGAMKATEKGFQACVSSPPFQATTGGVRITATEGPLADKSLFDRHSAGNMNSGYGDTEGTLGTMTGDDFWTSARAIVEQCYQVLEPGAHAVWVLKDYVKGGKKVPFCAQWQQMCEAVGFVTLHEHHAMLVRHKGVSTTTMDGEVVSHEVSSKSFFRRIAEKKGSPPIDFETILCMVKV